MHFKFVIGNTLVKYKVEFDYDLHPFEFDTRSPVGFLYNATLIERRLAAIDKAYHYRLTALDRITWEGAQFYLDCSVQYFPSNTRIAWAIRLPQNVTADTKATVAVWQVAFDPIILGTMVVHRPQLHEAAKQTIRDQARRQMTKMRDNAVMILRYLDEMEGPVAIEGNT